MDQVIVISVHRWSEMANDQPTMVNLDKWSFYVRGL